jgi:uncharacterized membrane protein
MNVFLWIVQAILAATFAMSGLVKAIQPKDKLAGKYPWMQDASPATVRFIGVMELLGAIGLIVPAATGIAPVLTPIAGTGLVVLAAATPVPRLLGHPADAAEGAAGLATPRLASHRRPPGRRRLD